MSNLYHADGCAYCGKLDCGCHADVSYHAELTEGWTPNQEEYDLQQYGYAMDSFGHAHDDDEVEAA